VLTSGHHGRDARELADRLGIPVRASSEAAERLGDELEVETFGGRLARAFEGLLELDFDHLLFAHGEPLVGGGKAARREFSAGVLGDEGGGQSR
jgi:hypothetical protein